MVGYGRLIYVDTEGRPDGRERYPADVADPNGNLDQMQLAHRAIVFERIPAWSEDVVPSDGYFMGCMRAFWDFHGVDRIVAYKRMHEWNMGRTMNESTGRRE